MEELCPKCEGAGFRLVERADGTRVAQVCECRAERRTARQIAAARIPERYLHCILDSFETDIPAPNSSLKTALVLARQFVRGYPFETDGKGLLLVGDVGVGKTHLAVGILQALIADRGVKGLFCHYRDLLKEIQDSYGRNDISERQVLAPVFDAEVLVIDELGAASRTDWVWDTVEHIINTRYNDKKTTIITTNYPNLGVGMFPKGTREQTTETGRNAQNSARNQTLGDRIGERMRSRLMEMCVVVEMTGEDFRFGVKRASFA